MIPKTLLLAFLSLQGTRQPQAPERGAALSNFAHLDVVNELTATMHDARAEIDEALNEIEFFTAPSVQQTANDQVPLEIPSEQEEVTEIKPEQITFTSRTLPGGQHAHGFKILNLKDSEIHVLKDAFKYLPQPSGRIEYAWGPKSTSKHRGLFQFSFSVPVQGVQVQFGWIEHQNLTASDYTITAHTVCGSVSKSGDFSADHWVDTTPIKDYATNFELVISDKTPDTELAITRVYYYL